VREEPFGVRVGGGSLAGCAASEGAPALLLHGGPAIPDYMGPCALELEGLFATIRYTQRGVPPSTVGPPYSIESHMEDALAVLDARGLERAWAIGHSWGGHLALHLLVTHPERLLGVVCVDPLGAFDAFAEQGQNLERRLTPDQIERVGEIEARRWAGEATDEELVERWGLLWPQYFVHEELASAPPKHVGPQCSAETNASITAHFERRTLELGLPDARRPALVVHGVQSPLPVESAERTAALIPGAFFEPVDDSGHFPWIEQPGALRRAVELFL
jgi:proline iminopeptidase